jgi:hypothetical protein
VGRVAAFIERDGHPARPAAVHADEVHWGAV